MGSIKLTQSVGASADDAHENGDDTGFSSTNTTGAVASSTTAANRRESGFRFPAIGIPKNATISAATLSLYVNNSKYTQVLAHIYTEAVDNAANYATTADVHNRAKSTANVAWNDGSTSSSVYRTSPDIASTIQELVNRSGYAVGNAANVLVFGDNSSTVYGLQMNQYDIGSNVPFIEVTWTSTGGDDTGTGTDVYSTLVANLTTVADSATGADAGEVVAVAISDADTATGTDTESSIVATLTTVDDPATGADAEADITATLTTVDDPVTATDGGEDVFVGLSLTDSDTATATDAEGTLAADLAALENATATDVDSALDALLTAAETALADDLELALDAILTDADTASGTDAGEDVGILKLVSDADTAAGGDGGELIVPVSATVLVRNRTRTRAVVSGRTATLATVSGQTKTIEVTS